MFDIKQILEPETLNDAINMLDENPNMKIIAGGTDVLIGMHHGKYEKIDLLSLRKINSLNEIEVLEDKTLSIGSMVTFSQIFRNDFINQHLPILSQAAVSMGGPQIRNVATIGGNICNGAVSADSAPTLFCLNAALQLESKAGKRVVPITEFYEGPGKVKLHPGEILTKILIFQEDYQNIYGKYIKFSNRKAMDIAKLSVAVVYKVDHDKFSDMRIALGVSAPTPIRCHEAEKYAINQNINEMNIKEIGTRALKSANPRNSWRGSKEYREHLIVELTQRAIKQAVGGDI